MAQDTHTHTHSRSNAHRRYFCGNPQKIKKKESFALLSVKSQSRTRISTEEIVQSFRIPCGRVTERGRDVEKQYAFHNSLSSLCGHIVG
jgi:hypothetical protein